MYLNIPIIVPFELGNVNFLINCKPFFGFYTRNIIKHSTYFFMLKETVSVISSCPPCKDDNAWFTTVPFKPLSYIVIFIS